VSAHITRSGRYSWHDGRLSVESITAWRRLRAADRQLIDDHTLCGYCLEPPPRHTPPCPSPRNHAQRSAA
jgi:hypothetical protein